MRFTVEEITQQGEMVMVTGETTIGTLKGIWCCSEPPITGRDYSIELGIASPSKADLSSKGKLSPLVYLEKDTVYFRGFCEDMDEDVYYLRYDIDWLDMLEMNEIPSKKQVGDYIAFSANIYAITIYPYCL